MKISVIGFMKSHLDSIDIGVCNENMPQVLENLKRFAGTLLDVMLIKFLFIPI